MVSVSNPLSSCLKESKGCRILPDAQDGKGGPSPVGGQICRHGVADELRETSRDMGKGAVTLLATVFLVVTVCPVAGPFSGNRPSGTHHDELFGLLGLTPLCLPLTPRRVVTLAVNGATTPSAA